MFTPPTKSLKFSGYSYQSFEIDDFSLEAGFRINYDQFNPDLKTLNTKNKLITAREFFSNSLSISSLYSLGKHISIGVNVNKTSRVPTIEELYSEGPHLAAYSYEIGNQNLESESGIGTEIFSYLKNDDIFFMITFFRNDFSYFITPRIPEE